MELRSYWQIVWRRRQIVLPLVLITFLASGIANLILPPTFKAETRVHVQAILPPISPNPYFSEPYYRTVHSEYLTDDLGEVVKSFSFAEKVKTQIEQRYAMSVDERDIMDSVANTKKLHRTLKITVATGNYALTKRIAESIDDVLSREGGRLVMKDDYQLIAVSVIDPPRDPTSPSPLRRVLDVLLHTAVALVVGTGIAFLLHALDDRVQGEADAAEAAGWPVIGAIPGALPTSSTTGGARAWLDWLPRPFRRAPAAAS